jgi:two-component system KDP operon response regulator KdpE
MPAGISKHDAGQPQPHSTGDHTESDAMSGQYVLLVDDDIQFATLVANRLERDGFELAVARRGAEAVASVDRRWPDLVILELILPDMRGERVAAQIKQRADLPIIVLSAESDVAARTSAIAAFAEDYLVKPIHYEELRVRIERVLRRIGDRIPVEERSPAAGLTLQLRKREAHVDGTRIKLTPVETRFVGALLAAEGNPVSTQSLLAQVWPASPGADPVYVWVTVRRLRQKLEPDPAHPRFLHTASDGGYRLGDAEPDDPVRLGTPDGPAGHP